MSVPALRPTYSCAPRRSWLIAAVLLFTACGGDATSPPDDAGDQAAIAVSSGDGQDGAPGMPLGAPLVVRVTDAGGRPVRSATVRFEATTGEGFTLPQTVTTDAAGLASTRWYLGAAAGAQQRLEARVGTSLTATFSATRTASHADSTYLGRNGYIEYRPGTLPLIISAPHGCSLRPAEIPDRTSGTTTMDLNTEELARAVAAAFEQATGERPHLVISRLHRIKLDPNRELGEAAGSNAYAQHAWREWMTFLEAAHSEVEADAGGLYLDLHGHGHEIARLELGYLLTASQLAQSDAAIDAGALGAQSSVRSLVQRSGHSFSTLLRGDDALGTLFENAGYPAVPSRQQPNPGTAPYFSGGYNTDRFGSRSRGTVDAVQIEAHYTGVRDTPQSRSDFASALVDILEAYFLAHYGRALD